MKAAYALTPTTSPNVIPGGCEARGRRSWRSGVDVKPAAGEVAGDNARHKEQLALAQERLHSHPGYLEYLETVALGETLWFVFIPNFNELIGLLDGASNDPVLGFELVQNAHRPDVRDQFEAETGQRLHNYIAATTSVIDHSRRIMKERVGAVAHEFATRKTAYLENPEHHFIKDLRNFTLHRSLPWLRYTMTLINLNTPEQAMGNEVELSVAQLKEWDGWTSPSERFLAEQGEAIALRAVIRRHADLLVGLNGWLLATLVEANRSGLDDVNDLVIECNAALLGVSVEEARRHTEHWTQMQKTPAPEGWPFRPK
jgi:hypothetical protein